MTEPSESERDTFAKAMAALQAELPKTHKGTEADTGSYTYKYADLSAITDDLMPVLSKHGLSFSAYPTLTEEGRFVLRYALRHVSGDWEGGDYPLSSPDKVNSQKIGSEITYARRYALCAVTGLAPSGDDDDAKAASVAQDSARVAQNGQTQPQAPARGEGGAVNDQISEWQVTLGWSVDDVFDHYSKWNKGAILKEASLADRQRFVQELAAHYMNEKKRQERIAETAYVPPVQTADEVALQRDMERRVSEADQAAASDEPPF